MIAVDTNVIVRVLTNDEPAQARRAIARMRSDAVWVSRTVLLEAAWVLSHAYKLDVATIADAFTTLLGVPSVDVEDRAAVLVAVSWFRRGMDFADALHLAGSNHASTFCSFDKDLAKAAKRARATPTVSQP